MIASGYTYGYSGNGKIGSIQDGNGNVTGYAYDGFDRPQTTAYAGGSTEVFGYDAASNILSDKRRDGQVVSYTYDTVNQVRTRSGAGLSNGYTYDTLGRLTGATGGVANVSRTYDALGHMINDTTGGHTVTNQYDVAGNRTRVYAPDGGWNNFTYLATGEMSASIDGFGRTNAFTYDDLGHRTQLTYPGGLVTTYSYGADLRLATLTHHMPGGAGNGPQNDVAFGYTYNPAGQIVSRTTSNDSYAYSPAPTASAYTPNALNQLTSSATPFSYDGRGNELGIAGTPAQSNTFSADDKLLTATRGTNPQTTLGYDALDRLSTILVGSGVPTTLVWNGDQVTAEYSGATRSRVYTYGPNGDEPLFWWEDTTPSRYFHADERGSIIAVTNASGQVVENDTYDSYGHPGAGLRNSRFGYTGQVYLPEAGLYHFKARAYDPGTGRFVSADPIGVAGGINLYGYVGADPVNFVDPSGLSPELTNACGTSAGIDSSGACVVTGNAPSFGGGGGAFFGGGNSGGGGTGASFSNGSGGGGLGSAPGKTAVASCNGPFKTISYGALATAAVGRGKRGEALGRNISISFSISIPLFTDFAHPFRGFQFSVTGQIAALAGLGAFLGVGEQFGGGISSRPPSTPGLSTSTGVYAEADVGAGPAVGGSVQGSNPLGSNVSGGAGGRYGVGGGAYVGVGQFLSQTLATKPLDVKGMNNLQELKSSLQSVRRAMYFSALYSTLMLSIFTVVLFSSRSPFVFRVLYTPLTQFLPVGRDNNTVLQLGIMASLGLAVFAMSAIVLRIGQRIPLR